MRGERGGCKGEKSKGRRVRREMGGRKLHEKQRKV